MDLFLDFQVTPQKPTQSSRKKRKRTDSEDTCDPAACPDKTTGRITCMFLVFNFEFNLVQ